MNGSNMCTATMLLWKKDRHIHIFGNVLSMWRLSSFQQQKVRSANVFEFQRFERGVDAVAPKHARCEAWFNWETGLGVTTWGIRWRKSYLLEVTGQPLQLIYRYWDDIGESHLVANLLMYPGCIPWGFIWSSWSPTFFRSRLRMRKRSLGARHLRRLEGGRCLHWNKRLTNGLDSEWIGYRLDTYYHFPCKIEPINKPQRVERFLPMNSSLLRRPSVKTEMPSITDDGMGRKPTGNWVRIIFIWF